jgi:hypothetical protein
MSRPKSYVQPGGFDYENAPINMALYSHPGVGKTVLWGSGQQDVLIMKSDPEGTISAHAQGFKFHEVDCVNYDDLESVYDWLKGDKPQQFKWVVWDSVTLFQESVMQTDIMAEAALLNPNQDPDVPSMREYLKNMTRIKDYIRKFSLLPYNFGASFLASRTEEFGTDGTIWMPQVQGKNMPSTISGYMNVVGYMGKAKTEDKKTVQRAMFRSADRYYAKDRWDALGASMDRPTLPKIEKLIESRRQQMIADATKPKRKAVAKKATARQRGTNNNNSGSAAESK